MGSEHTRPVQRRAFTGAWIETVSSLQISVAEYCRAFTGAWIETLQTAVVVIGHSWSRLHGRVD